MTQNAHFQYLFREIKYHSQFFGSICQSISKNCSLVLLLLLEYQNFIISRVFKINNVTLMMVMIHDHIFPQNKSKKFTRQSCKNTVFER